MTLGEDNFDRRVSKELDRLNKLIVRGAGRDIPAIYLQWVQRLGSPIALASSGSAACDQGQPFPVRPLAFYCTVRVLTTNNATNFWTIALQDSAATTLASVDTSAIAADVWTRLEDLTVTMPSSSNAVFSIRVTATLSPGSLFIEPNLPLLRT